jgi:hypothetical protein
MRSSLTIHLPFFRSSIKGKRKCSFSPKQYRRRAPERR